MKITKLGTAPLNGKFEVYAELTEEKGKLVPGMTCTLRFTTNTFFSAVSVPVSAIFEDDDGESKYVYLPGKEGKGEKKTVKVGITVGEKTQILDGLKADDEILPTKPNAGGEK